MPFLHYPLIEALILLPLMPDYKECHLRVILKEGSDQVGQVTPGADIGFIAGTGENLTPTLEPTPTLTPENKIIHRIVGTSASKRTSIINCSLARLVFSFLFSCNFNVHIIWILQF